MFNQIRTAGNVALKKQKVWHKMYIALALSVTFPVFAANLPDSEGLIQQLGIQQQDVAKLNQGEVVFFNVAETNVKKLTAGEAIYLPASPSKIFRFIKDKGLASIDTAVTAEGAITPQATLATFKRFGFKAGSDEAANFLVATPGSQFNLSTQEFQAIKTTSSAQPDAASQAYRKILLQRWQAYRKNGLKGIATYDRGEGTEANPGEELRIATLDSKVLAHNFPELYKA